MIDTTDSDESVPKHSSTHDFPFVWKRNAESFYENCNENAKW